MVAAMVPVVLDTETNLPAPKVTDIQFDTDGIVRLAPVQVTPSGEVFAFAEEEATATNELFA